MDMQAVLERISQREADLGLSDSEVSQVAGSRDLIRNWRRAAREGRTIQARHGSLVDIAGKLGVTLAWLVDGDHTSPAPIKPSGFAAPVTGFSFTPGPTRQDDTPAIAALRAVMTPGVNTPASYEVAVDMPAHAICRGDILVADMSRLPKSGDLALATMQGDGDDITTIVRLAEPWAILHDGSRAILHNISDSAIILRHPIVGLIRRNT
jgi:hypothetical protein